MGIAVGQSFTVAAHAAHNRQSNFGSLVSAINKGDVDAAQNAFAGLNELAPKATGPLRKGALDAMEKALKEADLEAAKKALKEIQQGMLAKADSATIAKSSALYRSSTVNILV